MSQDLDTLAVNTIRVLSVDTVEKANSGHPGAPMGMAPAAHVLFSKMKFNPKDPEWPNRDRFVLSNGHAVALLYTMLHLTGYDLSMEDLKQFRQLGSKTPGHPEAHTPGIEVTTGPLGQGIANAVGLAIAQANVAATYNKPDFVVSDNYTYCFFGDGCMMEGISHEACSLAGHLKLGKLICFYDDNKVSIDGSTEQEFDEDVAKRLEAYGWEVIEVPDADTDTGAILAALERAKKTDDRPTCIKMHTTIGYGSQKQGTAGVHGSPLKPEDVAQLKRKWGFDPAKSFDVPEEVYRYYRGVAAAGAEAESLWQDNFARYSKKYPELAAEYARRQAGKLPKGWEEVLPAYTAADPKVATRKLSGDAIAAIVAKVPEVIGGSADLTPSNNTRWAAARDFQPASSGLGDYSGRYIRYGVREHAMGAIMNGLSAYGLNFRPFAGTFLNFVSYAAGAVRLSALSGHPVVWVATHDSIGLGEDGPTHQPIETLAHFRAMPNLMVWRPADGNEVSAAYKTALESRHTPSIVCLTRQGLPELAGSSVEKAARGGYVVREASASPAGLVLVATGSEVSLAVDAAGLLEAEGIPTRVVSLPDFFTFDHQPAEYRKAVLPDGVPILSVEVLSTFGWGKYSHVHLGLDRFGASGKGPEIFKQFGFTAEGIAQKGKQTVQFFKGKQVISPLSAPDFAVRQ